MADEMILTEEDAKNRICLVLVSPMRPSSVLPTCQGPKCLNYWRWADAKHTLGYCNRGSKPEFA